MQDTSLILPSRAYLSRLDSSGHFKKIHCSGGPLFTCLLLLALTGMVLFTTGCELLEVGLDDPIGIPEEPPATPAEGAMVTSRVVFPVEGVFEWPWVDRDVVIANPYEHTIVDLRTGENLGRFEIANRESAIDLVKTGENTVLRFRVQGMLGSSEPAELLDRYGRPIARLRRMSDGLFLVKAIDRAEATTAGETVPAPIVIVRHRRQPATRSDIEANGIGQWHHFGPQNSPQNHSDAPISSPFPVWHHFHH